jgi:hypothetical protein
MRGANVGSWYAVPLCVIPDRGQLSENDSQSSRKQRCDVFHDDVTGSKLANKSDVLGVKPASRPCKTSTLAGDRDILAGPSAADDINICDAIGSKSSCCERSDICIDGHIWPVFAQDGSTVGLDFAEGAGSHSGSLKPEGEAADS